MCAQCEGGVHVCTVVLMCVMHLCACVCDKCDVIVHFGSQVKF